MTIIDLSARKAIAGNDKTLEEMTINVQNLVELLQGFSGANNVSEELKSHIVAFIQ